MENENRWYRWYQRPCQTIECRKLREQLQQVEAENKELWSKLSKEKGDKSQINCELNKIIQEKHELIELIDANADLKQQLTQQQEQIEMLLNNNIELSNKNMQVHADLGVYIDIQTAQLTKKITQLVGQIEGYFSHQLINELARQVSDIKNIHNENNEILRQTIQQNEVNSQLWRKTYDQQAQLHKPKDGKLTQDVRPVGIGAIHVEIVVNKKRIRNGVRICKWLENYLVYNPTGDNNCWFRALSQLLYGYEDYHEIIRYKTFIHILKTINEGQTQYSRDDILYVAQIGQAVPYNAMAASAAALEIDLYVYDTLKKMLYIFAGSPLTAESSLTSREHRFLVAQPHLNGPGHVYAVVECNNKDGKNVCENLGFYVDRAENTEVYTNKVNLADTCTKDDAQAIASKMIDLLEVVHNSVLNMGDETSKSIRTYNLDMLQKLRKAIESTNLVELHNVTTRIINDWRDVDKFRNEYTNMLTLKKKTETVVNALDKSLPELEMFVDIISDKNLQNFFLHIISYLRKFDPQPQHQNL